MIEEPQGPTDAGRPEAGDQPSSRAADVGDLPFEDAFRELERTVGALERGDLSLDASLALYERGVALAARCAAQLQDAELRVRRLDEAGRDVGELNVPT